MFHLNRVVISKNGTQTDISAACSDPNEGKYAATIVAAQDKLYVGSDLPFSHRFFMAGLKNTVAGTISVKIWDGSAWTAAVDVQDFTSQDGIPFAQNGLLRFRPALNSGWAPISDPADVAELSTVKVFNQYWVQLTFSAAFVFDLEYVGFSFAKDSDLRTYYGDLLRPDVMKAMNNNVALTSWDKIQVVAAEELIADLRKEEKVFSPNQLVLPEIFADAQCHKLAEILYSQRGQAAEARLAFATKKYRESMSRKVWGIDTNKNGVADVSERYVAPRLVRQ